MASDHRLHALRHTGATRFDWEWLNENLRLKWAAEEWKVRRAACAQTDKQGRASCSRLSEERRGDIDFLWTLWTLESAVCQAIAQSVIRKGERLLRAASDTWTKWMQTEVKNKKESEWVIKRQSEKKVSSQETKHSVKEVESRMDNTISLCCKRRKRKEKRGNRQFYTDITLSLLRESFLSLTTVASLLRAIDQKKKAHTFSLSLGGGGGTSLSPPDKDAEIKSLWLSHHKKQQVMNGSIQWSPTPFPLSPGV